MSTIERLSIQGIRSFGSKSEDIQSITFASPVTLILGENGCGKTTIIECLKYALTGECPPGSDRGKSFVHDPKIFSLTDSLGQIKLQVRNIRNQKISVCRSMKLSHKRGKMQFETIDATMNYIDNLNCSCKKTDSISKRCVDVDLSISDFMGVSKAIINNVIFCHQEDSSWPLDEAKKLKEKFDAIFGITEYNKAIEKVIKMRKDEMIELKVKEENLKLLIHLKQEMENKTVALNNAEQKSNSIKELCQKSDEEMKLIEKRLTEIHKIEYEIGTHQALKVEIETKQKSCNDHIETLSKTIKKMFQGDITDLDRELNTFRQRISVRNTQRIEMEEKVRLLQIKEKNNQELFLDLEKKECLLLQHRQKYKDCKMNCINSMKSFYKLIDQEFDNFDDNIDVNLESIQNIILSTNMNIIELSAKHDEEDQQYQAQIDSVRVELTKLEERISLVGKQRSDNENALKMLNCEVEKIELSAQRLKELKEKITKIDGFYQEKLKAFNQEEMRVCITNCKSSINTLQTQFRSIDEKLTYLNSVSKQMAEIKLKEKELEKKQQIVKRINSKHSDNLKIIFENPIEINFRRAVQNQYEESRGKVHAINGKINEVKLKEQSGEIKRKNLKDEISRCECELEELNEKIYEKCHSKTNYEEVLAKSKETLNKYQMSFGALKSSEAIFKKYINKMEDDPSCPLCHKSMTGSELTDLTNELTEEIDQLPQNMKHAEKLLKNEQHKFEGLLQLKPIIEKVKHLEIELPKRKAELKKIEKDLNECNSEIESLQLLISEPTLKMDTANSMVGDMTMLDETMKDVERLNVDIKQLKSKLPKSSSDESVEDLQLQKSTIFAELENERKQLETLQMNYENATNSLNKLRDLKNGYKEEEIKLQEGVQSLPQLNKRKKEIEEQQEKFLVEIKNLRLQVEPTNQTMKRIMKEKSVTKQNSQKKIKELQAKYDKQKEFDNDIQRLSKEISDYESMDLDKNLKRVSENKMKTKDNITENNTELTNMSELLDEIKTEYLNQEALERDLKDNRELIILKQKQKSLAVQYKELCQQIGDLDFRKVSKEKIWLTEERDRATVRKGELLGQMGEINNQMRRMKLEIEEPKYKSSIQNYKRGSFEVNIARRLISDLKHYSTALEWSLMKFHSEKMQKINRLIREYWRLIYRGNDIDYIQIQTDDINTDTSVDRRRSYNYRVIQSKNNSEIEMRGRCSAGQRVLASLIIRMALAETFSSNCGVLALDEPTTNLDRMNIMSLCEALNRIVEERQTQSNFMLIIITHDEDFISTLGKINSYHRVYRNDEGKSVVRKVKIL